MTSRTRRLAKRIETCLLTFCLSAAAYFGSLGVQARANTQASAFFGSPSLGAARLEQADKAESPQLPSAQRRLVGGSEVIGRLDIPSLNLSVPILADFQTKSLLHGIGHIPGSALPGGLGTVGLAGHRDTYFRPLRNIRANMDIRVSDSSGTFHYQVDSMEIVHPEDVGVLDIRDRPELTLITCYPFNFIGAAPLRFIVHAHLVSALPD